MDEIRERLNLNPPTFEYEPELWPGYTGPMLIGDFEWRLAMFGLSALLFERRERLPQDLQRGVRDRGPEANLPKSLEPASTRAGPHVLLL